MWLCISGGFPALPFLIDEDITTGDGAVVCRAISKAEAVRLGYRVVKVLKVLRSLPLPP